VIASLSALVLPVGLYVLAILFDLAPREFFQDNLVGIVVGYLLVLLAIQAALNLVVIANWIHQQQTMAFAAFDTLTHSLPVRVTIEVIISLTITYFAAPNSDQFVQTAVPLLSLGVAVETYIKLTSKPKPAAVRNRKHSESLNTRSDQISPWPRRSRPKSKREKKN